MSGEEEADKEDAGVPGVVGAITGAANSGPGKALLVPVAAALGKFWGERMDEITNNWREKRRRNLEKQHERVLEVQGSTTTLQPTEKQFGLISEWAERAQSVDSEEDPELSALWSSVLGGIYKNDKETRTLLDVVGKLTSSDAHLIFEMDEYDRVAPDERSQYERLASLGIVRPFSLQHFLRPYMRSRLFRLCIASILSGLLILLFIPSEMISVARIDVVIMFGMLRISLIASVILIVILLGSRAAREWQTVRLTAFGQRVRRSGLRYFKALKGKQ